MRKRTWYRCSEAEGDKKLHANAKSDPSIDASPFVPSVWRRGIGSAGSICGERVNMLTPKGDPHGPSEMVARGETRTSERAREKGETRRGNRMTHCSDRLYQVVVMMANKGRHEASKRPGWVEERGTDQWEKGKKRKEENEEDLPRRNRHARSPGKLVEAASPQVATPQHATMI